MLMKYIELDVRPALIMHGYDADNKEILEKVSKTAYGKKIILLERIQSVTEQYILVSSSHARVMYWEYAETMQQLKQKLESYDLMIN